MIYEENLKFHENKFIETKPNCDFCKGKENVWLMTLLTCEFCRKKFKFKVKHTRERK